MDEAIHSLLNIKNKALFVQSLVLSQTPTQYCSTVLRLLKNTDSFLLRTKPYFMQNCSRWFERTYLNLLTVGDNLTNHVHTCHAEFVC